MICSASASSPSREQRSGRDNFRRQLLQGRNVRSRLRGVLSLARHPEQALQHAPARRQSRIDVYASQKSFDGLRGLLQRHMAVPALLEQAAESGMQLL